MGSRLGNTSNIYTHVSVSRSMPYRQVPSLPQTLVADGGVLMSSRHSPLTICRGVRLALT